MAIERWPRKKRWGRIWEIRPRLGGEEGLGTGEEQEWIGAMRCITRGEMAPERRRSEQTQKVRANALTSVTAFFPKTAYEVS